MGMSHNKIFWQTLGYIRRAHGLYEMAFGTPALFRAARELTSHFEYAEKKKGLQWVLDNFAEHIDEYILDKEEALYATENYIRTFEESEFLRDQFTEH